MSNVCPKCKACTDGLGIGEGYSRYRCGSAAYGDKLFSQTAKCRISELEGENAKLRAELGDVRQRANDIRRDRDSAIAAHTETKAERDALLKTLEEAKHCLGWGNILESQAKDARNVIKAALRRRSHAHE